MLKLKLTTLDGLPPEIASEYKKTGDLFLLDTDVTYEDVVPLKNALTEEKRHRKEATQRVTQLEETIVDLNARAGSPKELEKSWSAKLDKEKADAATREKALKDNIQTLLVDNVAQSMASDISSAPDLLIPHIKARLTIVEEDGKFVTRVLDLNGKLSANSVNELKSEVLADARFAPIITASKASGGGAQGGAKTPAGGAVKKPFKDMSEADKVSLYKSDPTEYTRLSAEFKQQQSQPAPAAK